MRVRLARLIVLAACCLVGCQAQTAGGEEPESRAEPQAAEQAASSAGAAASWLDAVEPTGWNEAGRTIPAAPEVSGAIDERCRAGARPAETDADKQVVAQGWDLVGTYQGGWNTLVVLGTASYDGMCRPAAYHGFVFVDGTFAGTLAPEAMMSRTDGALGRITLQGAGMIAAEYARYTDDDPLCCPSRTTLVSFAIADGPVLRPTSASTHSTAEQ